MTGPLLEIDRLSVDFPGLGETVRAVSDCSLNVADYMPRLVA